MEREGVVSLWLGSVNSSETLNELLKVSYTEDGDFTPSKFAQYYSIYRYDPDITEANFFIQPKASLYELIEGFSYDEKIILALCNRKTEKLLTEYNSIILFYNFKYVGHTVCVKQQNCYFEFIDSVNYK